jgi:hypothetical protein
MHNKLLRKGLKGTLVAYLFCLLSESIKKFRFQLKFFLSVNRKLESLEVCYVKKYSCLSRYFFPKHIKFENSLTSLLLFPKGPKKDIQEARP